MKIAFVTTWARKCGLSTHAEHLAEEWARAGHEVTILNEDQTRELPRSDAPKNVTVIDCWKESSLAGDCIKHIIRLHPDVCVFGHAWEFLSPATLETLANGCHQQGCAFVVGWHNLVGYRCTAQELPCIDGHLVFHPGGRAHLESVGVPAENILYLPHACPPVNEKLRPECQNRVATYGLMYPSKGLEQTVTAVDVARKLSGRDITLDIYTSTNDWMEGTHKDYLADIERLIAHKGMQACVNVHMGYLLERGMLRSMCQADVLLYLYHAEMHHLSASGIVPFSFASGRLIIVSDIPHFQGSPVFNECRTAVQDAYEAGERLVEVLETLDAGNDTAERAKAYAYFWNYARHAEECAEFLGSVRTRVKALPVWHPPAKIVPDPVAYTVMAPEFETRIGVVIATKDRPEPLRTAIESAGEVAGMVVDDGSTKGACVQKAVKRTGFGLLRSDISHGPSWARNRGVVALETEWIQFLDDDDILLADWQARMEPYLDSFDVIIGAALVPDRGQLIVDKDFMTSQMCVRRSLFLEADGFRESSRWAEERDLLSRLESRMARVKRLEVPTVIRPVRGGSGVPPPRQKTPADFTATGRF